ncbi:uncharacterized protein LOC124267236 [Haliotis rubra]|uniref:uncharacterized protein LOC124267236 n=1 Tax=Haliotis rubra TaxID=36100 RepID=UPI001EE5DB43|nr:uncharacterized protein LOC124267236 [Haliotis rubra]
MARARKPNPMEKAHIHRLEENWHLIEEFLDKDDILTILCDERLLDRDDVVLIEGYSTKQGFKYLFGALTEYGGANGLSIFVEALKSKGKKYATIIAELSEEFDGETKEELELKSLKIFQLEGELGEEMRKNKVLEKKLEKLKQESASKDKEINRLKTELSNVTNASEGHKYLHTSRNRRQTTGTVKLLHKRKQSLI